MTRFIVSQVPKSEAPGPPSLSGDAHFSSPAPGPPAELRLRVGDYRVRFYDHGDSILVLAVKHRSEAYR